MFISLNIVHNSSIGVLGFLEFGENRRYVTDRDGPDGTSGPISLPLGFPVGSEIQTLAYVSVLMNTHLILYGI